MTPLKRVLTRIITDRHHDVELEVIVVHPQDYRELLRAWWAAVHVSENGLLLQGILDEPGAPVKHAFEARVRAHAEVAPGTAVVHYRSVKVFSN